MKKNEKETAFLIAVCAFISLLILSPFIFFLLSNEHKTETVYSNYMTIKNKYTKVKPAEKGAFAAADSRSSGFGKRVFYTGRNGSGYEPACFSVYADNP